MLQRRRLRFTNMFFTGLPAEERVLISGRAQALLDSFETLSEVDTEGIEPMITVLDVRNVFFAFV